MRIFIGSDERSHEAEVAIEESIRRNTDKKCKLTITFLRAGDPAFDNWQMMPFEPEVEGKWTTRFSCFRFAVPELCSFKGRAIYLDVDMIVLGDLSTILKETRGDMGVIPLRGYDTSACIFNCDKFNWKWWIATDWMRSSDWDIDDYVKYIASHRHLAFGLGHQWNDYDRVSEHTKIIHFTDMKTQPWQPWPDVYQYEDHKCPEAVAKWREYIAQ